MALSLTIFVVSFTPSVVFSHYWTKTTEICGERSGPAYNQSCPSLKAQKHKLALILDFPVYTWRAFASQQPHKDVIEWSRNDPKKAFDWGVVLKPF